jgi:hypothetical protein
MQPIRLHCKHDQIYVFPAVFGIHVFLGLMDPNPDPLVRGSDPAPDSDPALDPSIIKQK